MRRDPLVPRKVRELRADLRRNGFTERKVSSGHTVWEHPALPGHISVSGGDGNDALPYQEKAVKESVRAARLVRQDKGERR